MHPHIRLLFVNMLCMNSTSFNIRILSVLIAFLALLMPLAKAKADNSPLCFTANNGNVTVRFDIQHVAHTIQYSTDGTDWSDYMPNTSVAISANQSIWFRAAENQTNATPFASSADNKYSRFYFTSSDNGTVQASGNIMSLYGPDCPDLQLQSNAFARLFDGCTLLTTAPELPATRLANLCYSSMFSGCTSLVMAPALPADRVSEHCYGAMFSGCTSLTTAPALPAEYMEESCYESMFSGCTSLITAPALPALVLENDCYKEMFRGCTSLATSPALPATTLTENCYSEMFYSCTSLTKIPELPATTLANGCYENMFFNCTSLTIVPELPATHLTKNCYKWMFSYCSSLMTLPQLPADTLAEGCYFEMFERCSSLKVSTSGPGTEWTITATVTAGYALDGMFSNTDGTMNGTPSVNTLYYIAPCAKKETSSAGEWNDPARWNDGKVPVGTDTVIIKHDMVISAGDNAHCKSVVFDKNGKLTVAPSATLHTNTITNSDTNRIVIQSDASNSATVRFTDGTVEATVQMCLKGTAELRSDNRLYPDWQYRGFIGTPTDAQTLKDIVVYKWNEAKNNAGIWDEFYNGFEDKAATGSFSPWDGYSMANFDTAYTIRSYNTTLLPTNEPHTYTLTKTTSGNGHPDAANCGVNLLTNSYSAPINMDAVEMDDDTEHTFYFFNTRTHSEYEEDPSAAIVTYPIQVVGQLTTNPYIPAGQSFAVKTAVNGTPLTIPASAISTVSSGPMYAPAQNEPLGMVKITVESDEAIDELYLLEVDECTADFDNGYDGTKMFSSGSNQIYAQNGYGKCAVNADKSLLGQYVGFKPLSNGSQSVMMRISLSNLDDYDELYLYDHETDIYVAIADEEASYTFTSTGDETPRRFQIVGKSSDGSGYNPNEKARIEVAGNEIWLMNFERDDAQVILTDAAGRMLWSVNAKNGTTFTLPDLPKGIYFVSCGKTTTKYVQR